MHKQNEKFNKDTEIIKKNKNTMNEIKNAIESINSRMN